MKAGMRYHVGYDKIDHEIWHAVYTRKGGSTEPDPGGPIVCQRMRLVITSQEQMELKDFPFDFQSLSLELMSDWPKSKVVLVRNTNKKYKSVIYKHRFSQRDECMCACRDCFVCYAVNRLHYHARDDQLVTISACRALVCSLF